MSEKTLLASVVAGMGMTLLTGLFENTPSRLVGAVHYGYPFAWLVRLVVAPQYSPWNVSTPDLVGDIVTWSMILGIILFVLRRE
jgi:hypothetical protein